MGFRRDESSLVFSKMVISLCNLVSLNQGSSIGSTPSWFTLLVDQTENKNEMITWSYNLPSLQLSVRIEGNQILLESDLVIDIMAKQ